MKKKTVIATLVVLVLGAGGLYAMKQNQGKASGSGAGVAKDAVTIVMNQDEYEPSELTVSKGTTVVFVNKSSDWRWPASNLHPTHDIYPEFDPKEPVAPGASWSFSFDRAGSWRMHDHLAPYITGTILVKE